MNFEIVKEKWDSRRGPEYTWELESEMRKMSETKRGARDATVISLFAVVQPSKPAHSTKQNHFPLPSFLPCFGEALEPPQKH